MPTPSHVYCTTGSTRVSELDHGALEECDKRLTRPPISPRSQSDRASVWCAGTGLIRGGPTFQFTGLKGSAGNILMTDTTGHIQRSYGVCASMAQSCFGAKGFLLWLINLRFFPENQLKRPKQTNKYCLLTLQTTQMSHITLIFHYTWNFILYTWKVKVWLWPVLKD